MITQQMNSLPRQFKLFKKKILFCQSAINIFNKKISIYHWFFAFELDKSVVRVSSISRKMAWKMVHTLVECVMSSKRLKLRDRSLSGLTFAYSIHIDVPVKSVWFFIRSFLFPSSSSSSSWYANFNLNDEWKFPACLIWNILYLNVPWFRINVVEYADVVRILHNGRMGVAYLWKIGKCLGKCSEGVAQSDQIVNGTSFLLLWTTCKCICNACGNVHVCGRYVWKWEKKI